MDEHKSIKQNAEYFHQKMQQQIKKVDAELDNKIRLIPLSSEAYFMNSQETSELAEWHEFNQETIEALIEDGSDASQAHTIEYHFASADFDVLEKAGC